MNSYDFFIYEFICFMNSYMNSGVPRFQMSVTKDLGPGSDFKLEHLQVSCQLELTWSWQVGLALVRRQSDSGS